MFGPRYYEACIRIAVVLGLVVGGGNAVYQVILGSISPWYLLLGIAAIPGGIILAVRWIRDSKYD